MRLLAIEQELVAPALPNLREILRDEAASVWALLKRGVVRDLWFTAADRRAVLLLECANLAEARQHLAALPLTRAGLSEFTVLELTPYDGFERLFTPPQPR